MSKLKEKGITLVALVVIIIIILILAGVTLSLALSDTGLFKKAQNAADIYKSAQEKETTQLGELEKTFNEYDNGKTTNLPAKTYLAKNLKDNLNGKDSVIGKKVTGLTGGIADKKEYEWEIFYVDDSSIYLISKNYIKISDCPTKDGEVLTTQENSEYKGHFPEDLNLQNKYKGSEDITKKEIKNLNKDFFITKKYTSTDDNMKAVAYMLDTEIWTEKIVGNNDKVDYVIGGPSVELLLNAYNAKYGTNYGAKAYTENSTHGYKVSKDASKEESESDWEYNIEKILQNEDGKYDSTFVIHENPKADGMWLASPSAYYTDCIMYMFYEGSVKFVGYTGVNLGFRPVIILKSTTQLEKIEDVYKIVK